MSKKILIDIRITSEEFMKLYAGSAKNAHGVARDGRRIQFPANILRPFLMHTGVSGSFEIEFDEKMKFTSIRRI